MAYKNGTHTITLNAGVVGAGKTVWQMLAAASQRVALRYIAFEPKGTTPASAPLKWALEVPDNAGTSVDKSADLSKELPEWPGAWLLKVFTTFTGEPTITKKPMHIITLHQQARFLWVPPTRNGVILLDENVRLNLRLLSDAAFEIEYEFGLEE